MQCELGCYNVTVQCWRRKWRGSYKAKHPTYSAGTSWVTILNRNHIAKDTSIACLSRSSLKSDNLSVVRRYLRRLTEALRSTYGKSRRKQLSLKTKQSRNISEQIDLANSDRTFGGVPPRYEKEAEESEPLNLILILMV
jgi:hypothetical protein